MAWTYPLFGEDDPEIFKTSQFQEWLRNAIQNGEIPRNAYWNVPAEELMKKFWATVKEQMKAHHGGNKWIGTGELLPSAIPDLLSAESGFWFFRRSLGHQGHWRSQLYQLLGRSNSERRQHTPGFGKP